MTGRSGRSRPNIIIILIDTLRADHLSCYGHSRRTSPHIDALAERGCVFEKVVSPAPWTPPSHASLFTGTYPSRHGVDRSHLILDPSLTPLPEVLKRHGYRTYGVSSNYWLSRETRFDRGFDEFVHSWQLVQTHGTNKPLQRQQLRQDLHLASTAEARGVKAKLGDFVNEQFERARQQLRRSHHLCDDGARRVNAFVHRWLSQWRRDEAPFFAFLHFMEPHIRYAAPRQYHRMHLPRSVSDDRVQRLNQDPWKYLTGSAPMGGEEFEILRGLYDGEVSYVDYQIGQLTGMLESAGLLDDTAIFLTSDHGENLGEHGLMDHCYCLYDTLLRVPLIAHYPTAFGRGRRVAGQVQTHDLFPTILELAGIGDDPVWSQVQSRSLLGDPGNLRAEHSAFGRLVRGLTERMQQTIASARTFDHVFTRGTPRDPQTWATVAAQPLPAWAIDYQTMGKALGYLGKDVAPGIIEHARQMGVELPPQLDDPSAELTPQLIVEVIRDVGFHYFPQLAPG